MQPYKPIPRDEYGRLKVNGTLKLVTLKNIDYKYNFSKFLEEHKPLSPDDFQCYAYPEFRVKANNEYEELLDYENNLIENTSDTNEIENPNNLESLNQALENEVDPIFVQAGVTKQEYLNNLHNEIDKKAKQEFDEYTKTQSAELLNMVNDLKNKNHNNVKIDEEKYTITQKINDDLVNKIDDSPKSINDLILRDNKPFVYKPLTCSNNDISKNQLSKQEVIIDYRNPQKLDVLSMNTLSNQPKSIDDLIVRDNIPFVYKNNNIQKDVIASSQASSNIIDYRNPQKLDVLSMNTLSNQPKSVDDLIVRDDIPFVYKNNNIQKDVIASSQASSNIIDYRNPQKLDVLNMNTLSNQPKSVDDLIVRDDIPFVYKNNVSTNNQAVSKSSTKNQMMIIKPKFTVKLDDHKNDYYHHVLDEESNDENNQNKINLDDDFYNSLDEILEKFNKR